MVSTYSLLVHSCEGITWARRKAPNLYVVIQQEGQAVQRTGVIKRQPVPTWQYLCNLPSDSTITLRLWHDSLLRCRDVSLGVVQTDIATLRGLTVSDSGLVKLQLTGEGRDAKDKCTGTLLVQLVQNMAAAAVAIDHVQQDIGKLAQNQSAGPTEASAPVSATFETGLNLLITKLDVVVKIGDELAKIHPYANAAWKILTSVYQAVKTQEDTDGKLCKLVDTMNQVYSFTKEAGDLVPYLKSLEDKVLPIVKQTVECAMFIREYTGHGFASRAIRNTWDNTDKTIDDLSETLLKLKDSLESSMNIQTTFLSMQAMTLSSEILQKVDGLVQSDALKLLHPVEMNAASRRTCLKGTRVQLLDEITEWLMVPTGDNNILWLSGVAGSGKSTISTTISVSFDGLDRLGAFLFFDRNNPSRSHPDNVIRTLAHLLALSNPHISVAISAAIQSNPNTINMPLQTQFERLLLEPLKAAEQFIQGPILIILDALDECGVPDSRKSLLSVISAEFPKLPSLFRILITSRREADLTNAFTTHFAEKSVGVTASARDVKLFLHYEMERIRQESKLGPGTWPQPTEMQAMVSLAGGLFIWAATAVRFIEGYSPDERMQTLINSSLSTLDDLYTITLRDSAPWDNGKFALDAHAVLTCIVFGKIPMTNETIDVLLGSRCQSSEVLKYLGCVIQWRPGCVARILHASFADYLTDVLRSKQHPWAIESMMGHHTLAKGCLHVLNSQLKFNICGLKTSHILNVDVPNISSLVAGNISPPLSYSSCFWGAHIANCSFDQTILEGITCFFHNHFLFWLEVLSLLDQVSVASAALAAIRNYVKSYKDDLHDFIIDATKFVSVFAQLIAQSAPHIYLSAVPLAPRDSIIARQLTRFVPNTLHADGPRCIRWPAMQKVLRGHRGSVNSATFSPDGKQVVSGGSDQSVCVWDVETGALVATIHTDPICSVHFSPDGTQIASGGSQNNAVCVWDAKTCMLVAGPCIGHTEVIWSVHYSPNGRKIASGSADNTVRVWDARTGVSIAGPFTGHTGGVFSACFSPDGTRIASGSRDTTICVWDAQTGVLVVGPFTGHTSVVRSVCFSSDGRRIISGSNDETICVWDTQTGALIAGPFTGHTSSVNSVHISADDKQIVSGSSDGTTRIWDAQTGTLAGGPFSEHGGLVRSVLFSPDGGQIISSGSDGTVRIWDSHTGVLDDAPFEGHTGWVSSICFSPDGTQIGSGGVDAVYIWDMNTGTFAWSWTGGGKSWNRLVQFSPVGGQMTYAEHGEFYIWNVETGARVAGPCIHEYVIKSINFSPDGRQIASCDGDTMRVWDAQTGALVVGPFRDNFLSFDCVNFSPDGARIVLACNNRVQRKAHNSICVWDVETGTLVDGWASGYAVEITSVQFSPDGHKIVSGSTDMTVRIWDAQTGALIVGPITGHTSRVTSVHFSSDSMQVASGSNDHTVCVWDAHTGTLVAGPFTGHTGWVESVQFSPDGTQVASASIDHTIRVCEVKALDHTSMSDQRASSVNPSRWELIFDTESGWIKTPTGALMFWIPPWLREGLYLPHNTLVIAAQGITKLDLSRFVHGTEWTKCFDPAFTKSAT